MVSLFQARPLHISSSDGSRFIESFSHEQGAAKRGCHIVLSTTQLKDGHADGEPPAPPPLSGRLGRLHQQQQSEQQSQQQQPRQQSARRWFNPCRRRASGPTAAGGSSRWWICWSSRRRERKRRRQQHRLQLQQRREQIRRSGNLSETREDILHVSIEEWLSSQETTSTTTLMAMATEMRSGMDSEKRDSSWPKRAAAAASLTRTRSSTSMDGAGAISTTTTTTTTMTEEAFLETEVGRSKRL